MTRIGEDKDFATFVLSIVSDYVPAGEERIDIYSRLVSELYDNGLEDPLYFLEPLDDDLATVLVREGYADAEDDGSEEE